MRWTGQGNPDSILSAHPGALEQLTEQRYPAKMAARSRAATRPRPSGRRWPALHASPDAADPGRRKAQGAAPGPSRPRCARLREAGFSQIILSARDIVGHPGGEAAPVSALRDSGLRVTGFQVLRDFEGLSGHLHAYKVDVAKAMLGMCHALGSRLLLACSSTSTHATGRPGRAGPRPFAGWPCSRSRWAFASPKGRPDPRLSVATPGYRPGNTAPTPARREGHDLSRARERASIRQT